MLYAAFYVCRGKPIIDSRTLGFTSEACRTPLFGTSGSCSRVAKVLFRAVCRMAAVLADWLFHGLIDIIVSSKTDLENTLDSVRQRRTSHMKLVSKEMLKMAGGQVKPHMHSRRNAWMAMVLRRQCEFSRASCDDLASLHW